MSQIKYRKAKTTDANGIARVHVKTWQVIYHGYMLEVVLNKLSINERTEQWRIRLSTKDCSVYVDEKNSNIVGFVSFGRNRDKEADYSVAEIYSIYIDPDYWGSGVGSNLMKRALYELVEKNYSSVSLWVLKENAQGQSFYEKIGFTKTSKEKVDQSIPGAVLHEFQYRKTLTQLYPRNE